MVEVDLEKSAWFDVLDVSFGDVVELLKVEVFDENEDSCARCVPVAIKRGEIPRALPGRRRFGGGPCFLNKDYVIVVTELRELFHLFGLKSGVLGQKALCAPGGEPKGALEGDGSLVGDTSAGVPAGWAVWYRARGMYMEVLFHLSFVSFGGGLPWWFAVPALSTSSFVVL